MKKLLTLLLAFLTATAPAAEDTGADTIYTVHSSTHKLIALRGHVFRAHDDIIYSYDFTGEKHIIRTLRIVPGQAEAVVVSVDDPPCTEQPSLLGQSAFISSTERQSYNEDGGNVYIINNRREDEATEVEVKNLPEGMRICQSSAVPHEGKLLLILEDKATKNHYFAFWDVATGTLGEKRYPTEHPHSTSLIWRGGNLVWQITAGRICSVFSVYDLEQKKSLTGSRECGAHYTVLAPMGRQLVCLKFNDDVNILTPLDEPQVAADAPAPQDTILYGVSTQPDDTILCAPGKVYMADTSTIYRCRDSFVNKLSISNGTHFMETRAFNMAAYLSAHPGNNILIYGRYTGNISLSGGDVYLMHMNSAATPLRVKNLPSGYVIDACAAVPFEGKLALHLTHADKGESAYALLNTATAAIEGPLHPAPLSTPASIIQREAHIIWEIGKANAWDIPLTAYDLRTDTRVFEETLDHPRDIIILGDTAAYIDIHDLLNIIPRKPSK